MSDIETVRAEHSGDTVWCSVCDEYCPCPVILLVNRLNDLENSLAWVKQVRAKAGEHATASRDFGRGVSYGILLCEVALDIREA